VEKKGQGLGKNWGQNLTLDMTLVVGLYPHHLQPGKKQQQQQQQQQPQRQRNLYLWTYHQANSLLAPQLS
jgi:hypothetical protein